MVFKYAKIITLFHLHTLLRKSKIRHWNPITPSEILYRLYQKLNEFTEATYLSMNEDSVVVLV